MTEHDRKRIYHRLEIDQFTNLREANDDLSSLTPEAHIRNVSVGGAFLETSESFVIGCGVRFSIVIPTVAEEMPVLAIVRHLDSDPILGIGVEFLGVSPKHLEELTKYIQEYKRETT